MKAALFSLFIMYSLGILAQQDVEIVYKDKKFMVQDDILYNNHQPIENWRFKDSISDGNYVVYRDASKKTLMMKGQLISSKKEGIWKYYNKQGVLARELNYKNNKPHGEEKYFNTKNNSIMLLYTYYGGILEGKYFIKYGNGQLWEEGTYKNGVQEGEWKMWDRDGKQIRRRIFNNGTLALQEDF
ncbi:MAG: hypothetical protein HND27_08080 [Bacteroidetes bacterium]|nr:hypothetical protein [Flavobacteriales bacterium]NOG95722.1 hypothetical protein [Bacteroidota bacterium]WKZ74111.1 MAG: hypothetical protein QY303_08120 [Vicingaceae bacterium]MCL4816784.1 hypothetical protein [Flavobacteriales bacterium]CAG0991249.1 hypothetical protein FLAV_02319 [Flavobacteriales bacterium]